MNKKYILLLTAYFFIFVPFLYSQTNSGREKYKLFWDFKLNQNFTMDKYTEQTIIKNGQVIRQKIIRDYVILLPYQQKDNITYLRGKYYSYLRDMDKNSPYYLENSYDLDFGMDKTGRYYVDEKSLMPSIRHIPTFPENEVSDGDAWTAAGIEILEFKPPVTIPVEVSYTVIGREKKLDKDTIKILFQYNWNNIVKSSYPDIPYKYTGTSAHALWYDDKEHLPVYTENVYDLMMIYQNNDYIQYKGKLYGYYNLKREVKEREKVKEEIYDRLKKENKDMNIKKEKEAVIVNFEDIYFQFDDYKLTKEAEKKLDKIGKILSGYKDLNIIIKGHTDNIGSEAYNLRLSQLRAKSVLDYLQGKKYISDQGSYTGTGEKEPVADNRTDEGRSKNRRVEIIINPE